MMLTWKFRVMCDGFICCKCEFMSFGFCKQLIQSFGDLNSTIDTMVRFTVRYKWYVILARDAGLDSKDIL